MAIKKNFFCLHCTIKSDKIVENMILQAQIYPKYAEVLNRSLKHIERHTIIPTSIIISKRSISTISNNDGLVEFNYHLELKVYHAGIIYTIHLNHMSANYVPKLYIKDGYLIDLPDYLRECTSHIDPKL
jgi:hypothetical protein